jgi:hypothetical protein
MTPDGGGQTQSVDMMGHLEAIERLFGQRSLRVCRQPFFLELDRSFCRGFVKTPETLNIILKCDLYHLSR